jgi:phosphoesterase RecJ-like protein
MDLVRLSLNTIQVHDHGRIGSMTLNLGDFKKSGAADGDTENLINYVRKLDKVQIAVFLKERSDGQVKLSIRSRNGANVAKVAKLFGGGGHSYAAGAVLRGPLNQALQRVLEASEKILK